MKNIQTALHDLPDNTEIIDSKEGNQINEKVDYLLQSVNREASSILGNSKESHQEVPHEELEMSLLKEVSKALNLSKGEESRIGIAIKEGYSLERKRPNALSFMSGYTALSKEVV